MKQKLLLLLALGPLLTSCGTGLNPYDRSEWEKAEQPISDSTNTDVADGFAQAEAADSNWSSGSDDNGGWGVGTPD